nr:cell division protein ZapB [Rhizobium grahamii]
MTKKSLPSSEPADTLSLNALRSMVAGLIDQVAALSAEVKKLREENATLREENAELRLENTRLKVDNQLLRDEIARLRNLRHARPFALPAWRRQRMSVQATRKRGRRRRVARSAMSSGQAGKRFYASAFRLARVSKDIKAALYAMWCLRPSCALSTRMLDHP